LKKRRRVAAVIVTATAGILGVVWLVTRPESLEHGADTVISSILEGDARSLLKYVTTEERKALGFSDGQLAKLLDHFVKPRLAGFRPSGEERVVGNKYGTQLIVTRRLVHPDGREMVLGATVVRDGSKVQAEEVVAELVLSTLKASAPAGMPFPSCKERLRFFAEQLSAASGELEALGFRGYVVRRPPLYEARVRTWQEHIASNYAAIEKMSR
jgi:hypothetical protein